jgi:hypothetical protein
LERLNVEALKEVGGFFVKVEVRCKSWAALISGTPYSEDVTWLKHLGRK